MKKTLLSLALAALAVVSANAKTTAVDFSAFGDGVDATSSTPVEQNGFYFVGNNSKVTLTSTGFYTGGSTTSTARYVYFTPTEEGTLTVTATPSGSSERYVGITTTPMAPTIGAEGVVACTLMDTKGVRVQVSADLTAGTTYYICLNGNGTVTAISYSCGNDFVSISPEAGSKVDLDTEYTFTFAKAVKFTSYLSGLAIGVNDFSDATVTTISDDSTKITMKLNKELLAMYWGVSSVEDLADKFGSTLYAEVYNVCDKATGEKLDGNITDEDDSDYGHAAYKFAFRLGDPKVKVDPADGSTVESLSTIYFDFGEGIALADSTKQILVMKDKQNILNVAGSQLVFNQYEYSNQGYYTYTFEQPLAEQGTYEFYIPEGMFSLNGELNKTQIITISVGTVVKESISVTPAAGEVASLKDFVFTYGEGAAIIPSWTGDLTITNEAGETVATITQNDLQTVADELDPWADPTAVTASLATEITAAGTYTLNIPEGAFIVSKDYLNCEACQFTYTVTGSTVGINTVKAAQNAVIFNLRGQRVNEAKGIVLMNGKKLFCK